MAAKKRAGSRKKGSHYATIPRIPAGHIAFVQGNEVRVVKRKTATKRRVKRGAKRK